MHKSDILGLYEIIKHGDEEHKRWLLQTICRYYEMNYFDTVPSRGQTGEIGSRYTTLMANPIPMPSPSPDRAPQSVVGGPTGGYKYDEGKPSLWRGLLDYFPRALQAVALTSDFGAKKYKWKSWATVPGAEERYKDALVRHLVASSYEENDPESGMAHMVHVAWNALALVELKNNKDNNAV